MPLTLMMPTSILFGFVSYVLIAKWYVMPRLRGRDMAGAFVPLLLLHSFRYIGLAFLVEGVTAGELDGRFAEHAAYGDFLTAVLALVAIAALKKGWSLAVALVWIFNVVGTLDLVNAVARGLRYTEDGQLGATYFIPAVIVPALLVSHAIIFMLLLRKTDGRMEYNDTGTPR
jgi:hypothetical protein